MKFGDDHGLPMPRAVNSNMHITNIVESDSSRHLHSLVPRHSSGFEERVWNESNICRAIVHSSFDVNMVSFSLAFLCLVKGRSYALKINEFLKASSVSSPGLGHHSLHIRM